MKDKTRNATIVLGALFILLSMSGYVISIKYGVKKGVKIDEGRNYYYIQNSGGKPMVIKHSGNKYEVFFSDSEIFEVKFDNRATKEDIADAIDELIKEGIVKGK